MKKKKVEFSQPYGQSGADAQIRARMFSMAIRCPKKSGLLMVLGVDEACTNIIRHAYDLRDDQLIALSMEGLRNCVRMRLRDYGKQTADEKMKGRVHDPIKPGGLGLHLIRHAFDKVDYILKRARHGIGDDEESG